MSDIENRVMELEIKSVHQEDTIEQLNRVVIAQQTSIASLSRQLAQLQNKVSDLQENNSKDSPEPPPPHY